jgi:two-component sensor histidine kinase
MKILVADDDLASRKILALLLEKTGHEVLAVSDGTEAWKVLSSANAPRMAILDWLMPGIDGEELCRKIRTLNNDIPQYVIMLTIKGEKNDIVRGLEAGANDYLSKPYDPGELRARIDAGQRILELEAERAERIRSLEMNEKRVQALLAEKDILLYEIHHRIKNNMNMVINLLTLQAESIKDPLPSSMLRNAVGRIKSMGILYDRLYRSDSLTSLSIREYLNALIDEIANIFPDRYKIELDLDIEEIIVDVHHLSCIGMIMNELIFNSMKYAFKGRDCGRISVEVYRTQSGITITIEDDGIGIPETVVTTEPDTFGLKLVYGLADQIGGSLRYENSEGTRFVLEFPINGL